MKAVHYIFPERDKGLLRQALDQYDPDVQEQSQAKMRIKIQGLKKCESMKIQIRIHNPAGKR